mgnify:CR=1 FL=1
MKSAYIETSIISYLTARPSRDLRAAAWQQITLQWWEHERQNYELFSSELVLAEAGEGDKEAAKKRLAVLSDFPLLDITEEASEFASSLVSKGGVPAHAEADALHIATASIYAMDYLLTWNCRHIDNAARKPLIRSICSVAGYQYPEICTPLELLSLENNNV